MKGKTYSVIAIVGVVFFIVSINFYLNRSEVEKYIQNNSGIEKIEVDNYKVFLSGETHAMKKSYSFKKEIFSYLNKNAKVKNIIVEIGYCSGLLLNRYIQRGNEEDLNFYMNELKGTMAYSEEEYEFYKWLYKYNSELEENEKINIYGLDIEHQKRTAIKGISTLIDKNKKIPINLENAINKTLEGKEDADIYLKVIYENNKEEVKEYFGENYMYFENSIKSLYPIETGKDMRDKVMMRNFSFIYNLKNDEKFFGQFGSEHIYSDYLNSNYGTEEGERFGILLNKEESPVKGEVYSILGVYKNKNGYTEEQEFINYSFMKKYKEDRFINLIGKESPFKNKEYLFKEEKGEKVTTDYIQGIMIFNNSEQTREFNGGK
ncbi:MAG: erythromycin esterase family protein [Clostridium sp.]